MKIAVLLKTASGVAIDTADAFWRDARTLAGVMSPHDAHAVEEAVRLKEQGIATEIVLVAMAGAQVLGALREGLATGADNALLLTDPVLDGLDLRGRSAALAALLRYAGATLHLFCPWSGDIDGTLLWGSAGTRLGMPVMSQARSLRFADGLVRCVRQVEQGDLSMCSVLPCFVDLAETINKPRYPTMKGRQVARTKPVRTVSLAEIGVDSTELLSGTRILDVGPAPRRANPQVLDDEATAAAGILAFLGDRELLP